jgi:hypothetical protein
LANGIAEMNIEDNSDYEPLCRFGPGGDFVRGWPPQIEGQTHLLHSGIGRVLASLSLIINKLRHQQQFETAAPVVDEPSSGASELFGAPAITELSTENHDDEGTIDPETDSVAASDSGLSGEPLLFADDIRVGLRIRHKPKHHVRAHRRASKKRHGLGISGQGTLFDADIKSARIA